MKAKNDFLKKRLQFFTIFITLLMLIYTLAFITKAQASVLKEKGDKSKTITHKKTTPKATTKSISSALDFSAKKLESNVELNWYVNSEFNVKMYVIERSSDAKNYSPLFKIIALGNPQYQKEYYQFDKNPITGQNNYYRIKTIFNDETFCVSEIVFVNLSNLNASFTNLECPMIEQ